MMRLNGRRGLIAGFALCVAGTCPLAAQTLPVELVVTPPAKPIHRLTPAGPDAAAADRFTLTAAPLPPHFERIGPNAIVITPRAKSAADPASRPRENLPSSEALAAAGPPPVRERPAAQTAPASAPPPAPVAAPLAPPKPIVTAAATPIVAVARAEPLSERDIVDRANAFFNNLSSLVADFTQIGGDGRRVGGTLYLQRPGKVRFEYDAPATLEVIADGSSVAVRDTKLATQDLYSISQTPLKFLLREQVNLGQDIRITGISNDGDSVRLSIEDRSTLGGTSRITLYFDPKVETLTQWRITDAQGFQTTVILNRIDRAKRIDSRLFRIDYDRAISNNNMNR